MTDLADGAERLEVSYNADSTTTLAPAHCSGLALGP